MSSSQLTFTLIFFRDVQTTRKTLMDLISGVCRVSLPPVIELWFGRLRLPTAADFNAQGLFLWNLDRQRSRVLLSVVKGGNSGATGIHNPYVFIYIIYIYMYVCVCMYIRICMYACMYVYIYIYLIYSLFKK